MNRPLPQYYSELAPFRSLFSRGNPILTYHKIGPRPANVRLKGLYVSQRLFTTQLEELRRAGFQSAPLERQLMAGANRITITFDDGYQNVLRHAAPGLVENGFAATQFLVADFLGKRNEWDVAEGEAPEPLMTKAEIREWLSAGHEIGSHTLSHPRLTRLSSARLREEIFSSRSKLEDLFGRPVHHFCYPYGDWNPAVRDLVAEAGYLTACTTDPGVNLHGSTSPFELRRYTARYPTRNLKRLWRHWITRLGRGYPAHDDSRPSP